MVVELLLDEPFADELAEFGFSGTNLLLKVGCEFVISLPRYPGSGEDPAFGFVSRGDVFDGRVVVFAVLGVVNPFFEDRWPLIFFIWVLKKGEARVGDLDDGIQGLPFLEGDGVGGRGGVVCDVVYCVDSIDADDGVAGPGR